MQEKMALDTIGIHGIEEYKPPFSLNSLMNLML